MNLRLNQGLAGVIIVTIGLVTSAGTADTVDFDDLTLAPNSHWNGPDPAGMNEPDPFGGPLPVKVGSFSSGGVKFGNEYNTNYDSWGGFGYSNETDNATPGFGNQYSAFTGSGKGPGNDNYGVAFGYVDNLDPQDNAQLTSLPYLEFPFAVAPSSVAVTNMTYAALAMRDGDPFSKKFGGASGDDADWFKLTIYGANAQGDLSPGVVEFYLADYRFENSDDDYIVDTWVDVDLSSLSGVTRLYFNLSSSDSGQFGMNTPSTFAIDDLQFVHVPEPGTWVLLAMGMAALAWTGRRRQSKIADAR